MPVFRKPSFAYDWDVDEEVAALRAYPTLPDKDDRAIPAKADDVLLLATWNIANLGAQDSIDRRTTGCWPRSSGGSLIASGGGQRQPLGAARHPSPNQGHYRVVFSDPGGNRERFAYAMTTLRKVQPDEEVGEVRRSRRPTLARSSSVTSPPASWGSTAIRCSPRSGCATRACCWPTRTSISARTATRPGERQAAPRTVGRNGAGAPSDGTAAGPGHGPAGARGGRDRLVGRQAQTRSALLHPRRDRARRLQPPSAGARLLGLRCTDP